MKHFRTESSADELAVGGAGDGLEHLGHGRPVLSVQIGVNFVKEVEWCWVTSLDGKNQGKSAKTYCC